MVSFQSPRMEKRALGFIPYTASIEEAREIIYRSEASAVAYENHHSTISVTLEGIKAKLLADLSGLYRLQAAGKEGVEIPTQVTLQDVVIPLSLPKHKPMPPA